jgi:hypothetical protein
MSVTRREPLNGLSLYARIYKHFCAHLAEHIPERKNIFQTTVVEKYGSIFFLMKAGYKYVCTCQK